MAIKTMNLAKLPVWILMMIQIFLFETGISDGDKLCSCYTFEYYNQASQKTWVEAKKACKLNSYLVVMETEEEWKFINKEIQTRKSGKDDEWFIGLQRNLSTEKWTWVNGKALTIFKWRKDNCEGVCFSHIPVATNSSRPVATTPTTQEQRTTSTAYNSTTATVSTLTSLAPEVDGRKSVNNNSAILVIVAASLAGVLFVVLIILAVVLLLRRRKRRCHGKEDKNPPKKSSHQPAQIDQSQYEPVDHAEVAKLLGTLEANKAENKIEHVSPSENCVYAVVNKKDKKRNEGDLVYAELAEFDSVENDKTAEKPPSYEHTVYADVNVVPLEVRNPTSVDSTQPTYANVQTTGV